MTVTAKVPQTPLASINHKVQYATWKKHVINY